MQLLAPYDPVGVEEPALQATHAPSREYVPIAQIVMAKVEVASDDVQPYPSGQVAEHLSYDDPDGLYGFPDARDEHVLQAEAP